jgi:hypothetical protein
MIACSQAQYKRSRPRFDIESRAAFFIVSASAFGDLVQLVAPLDESLQTTSLEPAS